MILIKGGSNNWVHGQERLDRQCNHHFGRRGSKFFYPDGRRHEIAAAILFLDFGDHAIQRCEHVDFVVTPQMMPLVAITAVALGSIVRANGFVTRHLTDSAFLLLAVARSASKTNAHDRSRQRD